jgi:hypothetical protein
MSAAPGTSGSPPPCSTRVSRRSGRWPRRRAGPRRSRSACLRPDGRPSRPGCGRSTGSPPGWTRCAASSPCCPAASQAAGRCGPRSSASGRSPRWRSGQNSATCSGSATPMTWSATPDWTSPCTPPTPSAPPVTCPGRGRSCCAGRCTSRPSAPSARPPPTTATTPRSGTSAPPGWPPCPWPASSPAAGHPQIGQPRRELVDGCPGFEVPVEQLRYQRRFPGVYPHRIGPAGPLRVQPVPERSRGPRQQRARPQPGLPAPPHPLGDQRPLILRDRAADLQQQLVVRVGAHRPVQELHLAAMAGQLLDQQHLMDVVAGQPVRRG